MERITSRHNPLVARFRDAARRGAESDDAVLLDGEHLVREALRSGTPLEVVAVVDQAEHELVDDAKRAGARIVHVSPPVLAAVSPVQEPSGVVAIARCRPFSLADCLESQPALLVILVGVQDAGNVGAVIRAAEALGATGVICSDGTADPFGWKALRGSMGSTLRMRIAVRQRLPTLAGALREHGITPLAAVPRGGAPLDACNLRDPVAILLGAEGAGLTAAAVALAERHISLPMRPPVESLNVAVAAALLLYEASRQRQLAPRTRLP